MDIPTSRSTGTQPAVISLAKPWPSRCEVNGRCGRTVPFARTAVPITLNSRQPGAAGNGAIVSCAATTPSPPSAAHSAVIRPSALRRASSITWTSAAAGEPLPDSAMPAGPNRAPKPRPAPGYRQAW